MGEYQLYDFCAIDKSLSREEIEQVRNYSSRVNPTARRATFEYNYSDFRHDEIEVLTKHFDIMLYMSNWGSYRLAMKFPAEIVSKKKLQAYQFDRSLEFEQYVKVFSKSEYVIVDLLYNFEDGGWLENDGQLDGLISLRQQILDQDFRVLYLAWLHLSEEFKAGFNEDDYSEEEFLEMDLKIPEPPIPPNLSKLGYELENFVNFWRIDSNLINAVKDRSPDIKPMSIDDLTALIVTLPIEEKDDFLALFLNNPTAAAIKLKTRLSELSSQ